MICHVASKILPKYENNRRGQDVWIAVKIDRPISIKSNWLKHDQHPFRWEACWWEWQDNPHSQVPSGVVRFQGRPRP